MWLSLEVHNNISITMLNVNLFKSSKINFIRIYWNTNCLKVECYKVSLSWQRINQPDSELTEW